MDAPPAANGGDLPLFGPLLQSLIAGLATTFGGLAVFCLPAGAAVPPRLIALSLAFAAGVMTTVSIVDLWLPVARTGLLSAAFATLWLIVGAVICLVIASLPLPGFDAALARLSAHSHGRASCEPDEEAGEVATQLPLPAARRVAADARSLRLGAVMCAVLSLHNLPEGMVVMVAGGKSAELGLVVAGAIFCHNVAEGFSVAIPVFAGTGNRLLALAMTAASGLSEPLGAFCSWLLLRGLRAGGAMPQEAMLNATLCAVGGLMLAISATELLPEALRAVRGDWRFVALAAVGGAAVITATSGLA